MAAVPVAEADDQENQWITPEVKCVRENVPAEKSQGKILFHEDRGREEANDGTNAGDL